MISPSLIDSLGWTLLHFVWQGALIACATAVLLALLRNARPEVRYNIACTALLACLLWPAAELALRMQGGDMVTAQMRFADALIAGGTAGGSGGLLAWLQSQLLWIVGFWALCAAVLTVRMALGLLWIRRTQQTLRTDARLQASVTRLAARFGIGREVRLRVVDQLDSPVTAGWLRPVILVPASLLSGMPHELLEALLAHEMAHVRRHDYLVNLGQNVIEILLFYHPAVWWISGRIRIEREQIADDLAARHTGAPRTLARALSELERLQFSEQHLAIAANGGDLLSRVKRLVRPDTQALNWKAAIPVLGLAAACAAAYANASVNIDAIPAPSAEASAPLAQATEPAVQAMAPAVQPMQAATPASEAAGLAAVTPVPAAAPPVQASEAPAPGAEPSVLQPEAIVQAPTPEVDAAAPEAPMSDRPAMANFNSCKKPVWPERALAEKRTGKVTLEFLIGTDGKVKDSRIGRSSGHSDLDSAAQEGIELCTFNPAVQDGKLAEGWMRMQYIWTLK